MTFRPTDDVLDSMENPQQSLDVSNQENQILNMSDSNESNWSRIFSNPDSENDGWNTAENNSDVVWTSSAEEVKAPDLSELLGKSEWVASVEGGSSNADGWNDNGEDFTVDLSEIENDKWWASLDESNNITQKENSVSEVDWWTKQEEEAIPGKMLDKEREEIISWIEWSVHSKLDLLVDNDWKRVVDTYKKIYRIIFRWGVFIFVVILGIVSWILVQVKANHSSGLQLINDSTIWNMNDWVESNVDKILSNQISKEKNIEPIVSYGSISLTNKSLQSKSNLIKYQWIVLPQIVHLDFDATDFISLEKFSNKETSREDVEKMVKYLVTNDAYRRTSSLPNAASVRWQPKTFEAWLIDWFGLWCVKSEKVSDFVCDKLLEKFYKYGKYYDLSLYSSDVLLLVRELNRQGKDIQPICEMIPEYIWHSWVISADILGSVMNFCSEEEFSNYRRMVNFIDIENSLRQPELLDKVFDDPDLNAYKLLSAQQIVYRSLNSSSINENFIRTYLTFVQNLLSKDRGTNKYLAPIYKDMLYVFNTDVLYDTLQQKGKITPELTSKFDQINNGDILLDYTPLRTQLTTPDIIKVWSGFVSNEGKEITMEDAFARFYTMNDRLRIRRTSEISDTDMQVQAEIYSDAVFKVTWWQTLKATILLHKKQNVLYVKSINISNQRSLSDTLNIHAADWNVRFDAMLWYIDEQIWFWYKAPGQDSKVEFDLCDKLAGMVDIELYACDESSIVLYKWDVEYAFTLLNWILESYVISDSELESALRERFGSVMTSRENTPTVIEAMIDFELAAKEDTNIEKKLEVIDQFRIHFKLVPTISDIEWEDSVFMVEFSIWDFNLQARYDVETHKLTKISYVACDKTLEIRNLTIEVSASNSSQLTEILNNPRMFFANANSAAYRKYQRMCE